MKYLLAFLLLCVTASVGFADAEPPFVDEIRACKKYTFCAAQTTTGDCTELPASGDELVLRVIGRSSLTFYSIQSVGAHICNIMSNDRGHDAASGAGFQVNAISLTATTPVLSLSGNFDYIWVTCPTIGTSATVTGLVCPASN